uniref:Putative Cytochrome c peroxidase (Ccp) n=1 Tax=Magnetococcus massalia (strain MO-1) TaxID=451514 RepID=A0A1S7LGL2_MAGMO|nr:putative Cytochrome c peroxidase (ccp) [Candidatus Magnetococcus massalia]
MDNQTVIWILWGVAALGMGILWMLGEELSKRLGISGLRRGALMAGIGLGIVALSFKAFALELLNRHLEEPTAIPLPTVEGPMKRVGRDGAHKWQPLPRQAPAPEDNPTTMAKVTLGRALFHDRNLSSTGEVACSDCHQLETGGDDGRALSLGVGGAQGGRNAPTVWNSAFFSRLFWDGRAASLEQQAAGPLMHPAEMGNSSLESLAHKLQAEGGYGEAFAAAFPQSAEITPLHITRALAAFQRTLITPDTPYDRYARGDRSALTAQQQRGLQQFHSLGCRNCHRDPLFSAAAKVQPFGNYRPFPVHKQHSVVSRYGLMEDQGRQGRWRVPSLRNVALTAPYFHNGSVAELKEAVRVMGLVQLNRTLTEAQIEDLTAFLHGLDHDT